MGDKFLEMMNHLMRRGNSLSDRVSTDSQDACTVLENHINEVPKENEF